MGNNAVTSCKYNVPEKIPEKSKRQLQSSFLERQQTNFNKKTTKMFSTIEYNIGVSDRMQLKDSLFEILRF